MEYTTEIVENLLRNYYSLQSHTDATFSDYFVDLTNSLSVMKRESEVLYSTIVNVMVNGMPIQEKATIDGVTTRQVNYRLHDGLDLLTMIMNGEFDAG